MKHISRIALVGVILFASASASQGGVFRNKDGREISAEIVAVRGEQVEMKVRPRQTGPSKSTSARSQSEGKLIKEVEWSDTAKEAHRVEPLPEP